MADKTNIENLPAENKKLANKRKQSRSPEEKAKANAEKAKRRQEALSAKAKAFNKADEERLPWDDTIRAAAFVEDFDKAYTEATTSPNALAREHWDKVKEGMAKVKPAPASANDNTETRNGEPPTEETSAAGASPSQEPTEAPDETPVEVEPQKPTEEIPVETVPPQVPAAPNVVRMDGESKTAWKARKRQAMQEYEAALKAAQEAPAQETPAAGKTPTQELVDAAKAAMLPADKALKQFAEFAVDAAEAAHAEPFKSAEESAKAIVAALDAKEEAEIHVCDELVKESEAADAAKKADTPAETPAAPAADETPAEAPVEEPVAEVAPVKEEPKPVEAKKPTLTLAAGSGDKLSPEERARRNDAAKKFYGDAFTEERANTLGDAVHWLNKAIQFEQAKEMTKLGMALKRALTLEHEAFGVAVPMARAA